MLSDYEIIEQIYESNQSIVYRGRKECKKNIILKVLKQEYPTQEEITRYKQEFAITQNLNIANVITAYALEEYQNTLVIIFEDFGGQSLNILQKKQKLTIKNFLEIAIKITSGLAGIHAAKIVHKDINPSNIVFNPKTKQLKIIDFGISIVLPKENLTLKNPNTLEGTLLYISPEQTGRMNCGLDYRSDFYSLGVTLYELLTNRLPFTSDDLLELIHCHIAKQPIPPKELNSEIPAAISDIILKLMAKNAEERYQSAWGIKVDLETCLQHYERSSSQFKFTLAKEDISDRFQIRQKLYGRKNEIDILLKAIKNRQFQKEIMLISGYSGIGKSALVREVYKPITEAKGYLITGKFDQYQRDRPYSAIVKAFRQLAKYLLGENKTDLNKWKNKLLEALKENGQIIIDLIPEIKQIIGDRSPVTNLPATAAQNRFNWVFVNFVKVFAKKEHPLVIFLDDLQWADSGSLQLIQLLLTTEEINYIFLIGAYRNNEVSSAHPLILTIDKLRQSQVKVSEIYLSALQLSDITELIADSFNCNSESARSLAKLVLVKTKGNPFFINEFLRSLYRENLLSFNYQSRGWEWNLAEIKSQDITDNVVELMSGSIQKLNLETQKILQLSACIGSQFEIQTLVTVGEKSLQETALLLREAAKVGLVFPLAESYKSIELNVTGGSEKLELEYKFVHDRIQQAAYSLIPVEELANLHQKIGKLLLKSVENEAVLRENIFNIVNHLNLAIELLSSQKERDELAKFNLIAGQKAKLSAAHQTAFEHFKLGLKLLGENPWQRNYKLTLEIYLAATEAACINCDYQSVEKWANEIIQRATDAIARSQGYKIKLLAYHQETKFARGLKLGILGLKELGIIIPRRKIWLELTLIFQIVKHKLFVANTFLDRVKNLPIATNSHSLLITELLEDLVPSAYMSCSKTYLLIILKQVNLMLEIGTTSSSYNILFDYVTIVSWGLGDIDTAYKIAREALLLSQQNNNCQYESATACKFNAFIRYGKEHLNRTLDPLVEGYLKGLETGDLTWAIANINWYLFHSFIISKKLERVEKEIIKYTKIIAKIKTGQDHLLFDKYLEEAIEILSSPDAAKSFIEKQVNYLEEIEEIDLSNLSDLLYFYKMFYPLVCCYLFGLHPEANYYVNKAKEKINGVIGQAIVPVFYFYDSLNKITLISEKDRDSNEFWKEIAKNQKKLAKLANHAPMNYQHKYDLVAAEIHRLKGNKEKAANLYEKAISGAKQHQYINEQALACELTAKFYLEWNKPTIAKTYTSEARYHYLLWGAKAKVKYLEENYFQLFDDLEAQKKQKRTEIKSITTTKETDPKIFDVDSLLKANQILSRELNLAKLLEKIIKIAIENAGARDGYLILNKAGNLSIEAISKIDSQEVTILQSIAIDSKDSNTNLPLLPEKIINYVARSHEDIVLDNPRSKVEFASDRYIQQKQPKSILCAPLVDRGKLIGLIYLENNLTVAAFTEERIQLLKALCAPAAVSIKNAQLYEERTKAELALRQSEQKLAQFLEALPVGILITDRRGKPYYLNQIAKEITGKGLVDSITLDRLSETYNIYLAGSDRLYPPEKSPIRKALRGEKSYTPDVEIRSDNGNGAVIPLDIWTTPIVNQTGIVDYTISAFQDISDRKKLIQENLLLQQVGQDLTYSYQIGGGLAANAASYVVRSADRQLYQEILQAKFCYIFNARQMGKSSLRNKIMNQLQHKGYRCGAIDLTEIGSSNLNAEQWYASLIFNLAKSLVISQFNTRSTFANWWKSLDPISPISKFKEFIYEIILKNIDSKIVIFIDEIDSIRRLSFDTKDFLALIRLLYDARPQNPDLNRLTFVLLGAANLSPLTVNPDSTPFNIGSPISLEGFKIDEIQPLARGLSELCDDSKKVMEEILAWTGGQPFLTQKICYLIKQYRQEITAGTEAEAIDRLVKNLIIANWKSTDNPAHFQVIEQNILNSPNRFNLLEIYRAILQGKQIPTDDSQAQIELILSGLVCSEFGFLKVFNRIYMNIFNLDWLERDRD